MKIIIGLGNPGKEYEKTYHNMGFGVVDALAERLGRKIDRVECSALTAVKEIDGEKIVLVKPVTYMNLSGEAVKSVLGKYHGTAEDLVVVYDDVDLPRFTVRARKAGSAGTHNGMRSVVASVGTEAFRRVRIGVGKPEYDLAEYVLSKPSAADEKRFDEVFAFVAEQLDAFLRNDDFDGLMRAVNGKEPKGEA